MDNVQLLLDTAIHLVRVRQWKGALETTRKVLAVEPDNATAHAYRAYAYVGLKQYKPALAAAQEAQKANPADYYGHYAIAYVYLAFYRWKLAEKELRAALKLDPNRASLHSDLAWSLLYQERGHEAWAAIQSALKLDSEDSTIHFRAAQITFQVVKWKDSQRHVLEALRLDPENSDALRLYGFLKAAQGDFDAGHEGFAASLRIDPHDPQTQRAYEISMVAKHPFYHAFARMDWGLGKVMWPFLVFVPLLELIMVVYGSAEPYTMPGLNVLFPVAFFLNCAFSTYACFCALRLYPRTMTGLSTINKIGLIVGFIGFPLLFVAGIWGIRLVS